MRRLGALTSAGALLVGLTVGGCSAAPTADRRPVSVASGGRVAPPVVDPMVTRQVCRDATQAAAAATSFFAAEFAVIERDAASGDHHGLVAAADAIQKRFVELARLLATWARRPVSPDLRGALTQGNSSLVTISSVSYRGNQSDISRQLAGLSQAIGRVCR